MSANRMRVLGGSIYVGDYITTDKPTDVWWKVENIRIEELPDRMIGFVRYFDVVNKGGYRKEMIDRAGSGGRFYKWIEEDPADDYNGSNIYCKAGRDSQ